MTDLRKLQEAIRRALAPTPGARRGAIEAVRELYVNAPASPELAAIARETAGPMFETGGVVSRWWGWIYDALEESLEDGQFVTVLIMRSDLEIVRAVYRGIVDEARLDEFETEWVDEMIRALGDEHKPSERPQWVPASHWWWDWSEEAPERVRAALDAGDPFDVVFRIRRLGQRVPGTEAAVAKILPLWWERAREFLLVGDELEKDVWLARAERSNLEYVRETYPEAAASIDTAAFDEAMRPFADGSKYAGGGVPPTWIGMSEYAQHWWWGLEPP